MNAWESALPAACRPPQTGPLFSPGEVLCLFLSTPLLQTKSKIHGLTVHPCLPQVLRTNRPLQRYCSHVGLQGSVISPVRPTWDYVRARRRRWRRRILTLNLASPHITLASPTPSFLRGAEGRWLRPRRKILSRRQVGDLATLTRLVEEGVNLEATDKST